MELCGSCSEPSPWLPEGTKRLIELLAKTIRSGDFNPFSGEIYSQDKTIRNGENQTLSPDDIITMDWLSDNIIGEIPVIDELEENAKPVAIQTVSHRPAQSHNADSLIYK